MQMASNDRFRYKSAFRQMESSLTTIGRPISNGWCFHFTQFLVFAIKMEHEMAATPFDRKRAADRQIVARRPDRMSRRRQYECWLSLKIETCDTKNRCSVVRTAAITGFCFVRYFLQRIFLIKFLFCFPHHRQPRDLHHVGQEMRN